MKKENKIDINRKPGKTTFVKNQMKKEEFNLSEKIEQDERFMFIKIYYIKEFIKKLKEEWKLKMRRMELISVEVAIYELNQLVDKRAGEKLLGEQK